MGATGMSTEDYIVIFDEHEIATTIPNRLKDRRITRPHSRGWIYSYEIDYSESVNVFLMRLMESQQCFRWRRIEALVKKRRQWGRVVEVEQRFTDAGRATIRFKIDQRKTGI